MSFSLDGVTPIFGKGQISEANCEHRYCHALNSMSRFAFKLGGPTGLPDRYVPPDTWIEFKRSAGPGVVVGKKPISLLKPLQQHMFHVLAQEGCEVAIVLFSGKSGNSVATWVGDAALRVQSDASAFETVEPNGWAAYIGNTLKLGA